MKVEEYLNRIGFKGSASPTIDVLRRLHRQHMLTVPFENLDIHQGKPIILDPQRFYRKIVGERRGGYCYELNGCFALLLKKLGFEVSILSARVAQKSGGFSPEFDHMVLLVRLKENLLVDVGFGDSFTEPKPIDTEESTMDHGYFYRIRGKNRVRTLSRRANRSSRWHSQYKISLLPRRLSDFVARNKFQQTSPHSHFTQHRLISKLTRSGRITLTDSKLITIRDHERVVREVRSQKEFDELLSRHFQLVIEETLRKQ